MLLTLICMVLEAAEKTPIDDEINVSHDHEREDSIDAMDEAMSRKW